MRHEYDFSSGQRGKFYRPDALLNIPIYLDGDIFAYLSERANSQRIEVSQLIHEILRKTIDLVEAIK
jgi:hypothetical protein